jgi:hypothetical protein
MEKTSGLPLSLQLQGEEQPFTNKSLLEYLQTACSTSRKHAFGGFAFVSKAQTQLELTIIG